MFPLIVLFTLLTVIVLIFLRHAESQSVSACTAALYEQRMIAASALDDLKKAQSRILELQNSITLK